MRTICIASTIVAFILLLLCSAMGDDPPSRRLVPNSAWVGGAMRAQILGATHEWSGLPQLPYDTAEGIRFDFLPGDIVRIDDATAWYWYDGVEWVPLGSGKVAGDTIFNLTEETFIRNIVNYYNTPTLFHDKLSGAVDGENTVFRTSYPILGTRISVSAYYEPDSFRMEYLYGSDFIVSGTDEITFLDAPLGINPYTGATLDGSIYADYVAAIRPTTTWADDK
jgi:hypothetical protein